MKLTVAGLYSNYVTSIAEEADMTQEDAFVGRPVGDKLILAFERVGVQETRDQSTHGGSLHLQDTLCERA